MNLLFSPSPFPKSDHQRDPAGIFPGRLGPDKVEEAPPGYVDVGRGRVDHVLLVDAAYERGGRDESAAHSLGTIT